MSTSTPRHRNRAPTSEMDGASIHTNLDGNNEAEDVLEPWEQTNRPVDDALRQQRVQAWHPILDPRWVICALYYLGIIMVPVGFKFNSLANSVVELSTTYDGHNMDANYSCGINNTYNAGRICNLTFTVPKFMESPVLVYFELTNFHQNYRKYVKSFDPYQLYGDVKPQASSYSLACAPLDKLGNITLHPCGLIANTMFNDVISLVPTSGAVDPNGRPLQMLEEGIAWQSDIDYMYRQPDGFNYQECPDACDEACCQGDEWSCVTPYVDPASGTCYRYYYPNDDTTQYLYETYPEIISPLEGVLNEHFIVWMRVSPTPDFRKLYGWFNQSIDAGTELVFRVRANYAVTPFSGTKTLVISTNNIFGGQNWAAYRIFVGTGGFFLVAATFLLAKHLIKPRKLGDRRYLHYKQD